MTSADLDAGHRNLEGVPESRSVRAQEGRMAAADRDFELARDRLGEAVRGSGSASGGSANIEDAISRRLSVLRSVGQPSLMTFSAVRATIPSCIKTPFTAWFAGSRCKK
jgi:hypothetical protein